MKLLPTLLILFIAAGLGWLLWHGRVGLGTGALPLGYEDEVAARGFARVDSIERADPSKRWRDSLELQGMVREVRREMPAVENSGGYDSGS